MLFVKTEGKGEGPEGVVSSVSRRGFTSWITDRTDLNFESLFRVTTGTECLRVGPLEGGEIETGGEVERGGVAEGDGTVAQSSDSGVCVPFVPGSQDVILLVAEEGNESIGSRSGVELVKGLAVEEVAPVMIDNGASMLNI